MRLSRSVFRRVAGLGQACSSSSATPAGPWVAGPGPPPHAATAAAPAAGLGPQGWGRRDGSEGSTAPHQPSGGGGRGGSGALAAEAASAGQGPPGRDAAAGCSIRRRRPGHRNRSRPDSCYCCRRRRRCWCLRRRRSWGAIGGKLLSQRGRWEPPHSAPRVGRSGRRRRRPSLPQPPGLPVDGPGYYQALQSRFRASSSGPGVCGGMRVARDGPGRKLSWRQRIWWGSQQDTWRRPSIARQCSPGPHTDVGCLAFVGEHESVVDGCGQPSALSSPILR